MVTFAPETPESVQTILIAIMDLERRVEYNDPVPELRQAVLWYYHNLAQLPSVADIPPHLVSRFLTLAHQAGLELAWPPTPTTLPLGR